MTPQLREFLTRWVDWAESGANTPLYAPDYGLCCNVRWATGVKYMRELEVLLKRDFPPPADFNYPFGGFDQYDREQDSCTVHKNPDRIAWVRKVLKEEPHEYDKT